MLVKYIETNNLKSNIMNLKLLFFLTSLLITSQVKPQDLTSNLILDMAFSNEVTDLTNNSSPILSGFETYTTDRGGNFNCAVTFNGQNNEFIEIPHNNSNSLINGDDFTVSLWFKMNNNIAGDLETLFLKNNVNQSNSFFIGVYDLNTPLINDSGSENIWDNDWNQEVDVVWDNTDWHHLVMVISNNEVKLYRDNILRGQINNNNFNIGNISQNYKIGKNLNGVIDDLKVYRRALNANEVDALYNLSTNCQSLSVSESEISSIKVINISDKIIGLANLSNAIYMGEIYNTTGKSMQKKQNISSRNNLINLTNLPAGIYFLNLKNKVSMQTQNIKFIIR